MTSFLTSPQEQTKLTNEDILSNMPPLDRSAWRNTYIYASNNRSTVLGGLWASEGVTNADLYSMLEVFLAFTDTFDLCDSGDQLVKRDGEPLQYGNYYIVTAGRLLFALITSQYLMQIGSITVTDEVALMRIIV